MSLYEIPGYDRWKLAEPPEAVIVCTCDHCGDEIYAGEDIIKADGDTVHEDCFLEYAMEILNARKRVASRDDRSAA